MVPLDFPSSVEIILPLYSNRSYVNFQVEVTDSKNEEITAIKRPATSDEFE